MSWGKGTTTVVVVAAALVICAMAPAVLVDPLFLAVAQIRSNAAKTAPVAVTLESSEIEPPAVTSAQKKSK